MTVRQVQVRGPLCVEMHTASVCSAELGVIYSTHNQMTDAKTREIKLVKPAWAIVSFRLGVLVKGSLPNFYEAHNLACWCDRLVNWKETDLASLQEQVRDAVEMWATAGGYLGQHHHDALKVRG